MVDVIVLLANTQEFESGAEKAGYYFGAGLVMLLWLWAAIKSFAISRRPQTSTLCASALGMVFLVFLFSGIVNLLKKAGSISQIVIFIFFVLFLLIIIAALVMAIVGLVTYRTTGREYTQGKKQGIWAIVIASLFLCLAGGGAIVGLMKRNAETAGSSLSSNQQSGKAEIVEFVENNFTYNVPAAPWTSLDPKLINEEASVMLMRRNPQLFFAIIAENGAGVFEGLEGGFTEIVKANLKSVATFTSFGEQESVSVGDMSFQRFEVEAKIPSYHEKLFYVFYLHEHNGFYYQLMLWSTIGDKHLVRKETTNLVSRFGILDTDRQASVNDAKLENVNAKGYGFVTNLETDVWKGWDGDFQEDHPGKQFGATGYKFERIAVEAVPLSALQLGTNELVAGLVSRHGFSWPNEEASVSEVQHTGAEAAWEYRAGQKLEGYDFDFIIRILKRGEMSYSLTGWYLEGTEGAEDNINEAFNNIEIFTPTEEWVATENELEGRKNVYNQCGLTFFTQAEYERALDCFRMAYKQSKIDPVVLENISEAHIRLGSYEDGLAEIEDNIDAYPDHQSLKGYRAYLVGASGDLDQSKVLYEELFADGFEDDDELLRGINLYVDADVAEDSIPFIDAYISQNPSAKVRRWRAVIPSRAGNYEYSIELLKELKEEFPDDALVSYELGEAYNNAEQYEEASNVAAGLVEGGFDYPRAVLIKGWSEYYRGWYQRARDTFKDGLGRHPSSEDLKEALRIASAELGQGENYAVNEAVESVEIPRKLSQLFVGKGSKNLDEEKEVGDGYGASFESLATGIHFTKGQSQKTTVSAILDIHGRSGVNRFSTLEISFNPLYEKLFVNELTIYDEQGQKIAVGDPNEYFVTDDRDEQADYSKILNVPVPGLKIGSRLQYRYTRETIASLDEPEFKRVVFSNTLPLSLRCVFVTGDLDQVNYLTKGEIKEDHDDSCLSWTMRDLPPYRYESSQPDLSMFLPVLFLGSGSETWEEIGKNYLNRIKDKLVISEEVKMLAGELTKGVGSEGEKIGVLAEYVRSELEYKAIEFGKRGLDPHSADRILRDRYGDCKDHSLLFSQLLKASGIPASLTLVDTGWALQKQLPSLDQFNHMIVYLPSVDAFIDCTDKHFPSRSLWSPISLGEHYTLVLDEKSGPKLQKIASYPEGVNVLKITRAVADQGGGGAVVNEVAEITGYRASSMRGYLASADSSKRENRVRDLLSGSVHLEIEQFRIENLEDSDKPLKIHLSYRLDKIFEQGEESMVVAIPHLWEEYYLWPTHVKGRRNPFVLSQDFTVISKTEIRLTNTIQFPEGWRDSIKRKQKFSKLNREAILAEGGKKLIVTSEVKLPTGRFLSEDYEIYERQLRASIDSLKEPYRLIIVAKE